MMRAFHPGAEDGDRTASGDRSWVAWGALGGPRAQEPAYDVFDPIASGGMATVHLGRRRTASGCSGIVAVKRLHPHLAADPDFTVMLVDEARLSARVRHPNVVSVRDVVHQGGLALVMDYVHGASLAELVRAARAQGERVRPSIASAIVCDALEGLHAAHEALGEDGAPLLLVHRDVSPHNILVGVDGAARILDFGVAKARVRVHVTREGIIKGKLAYMAPEQLEGQATRRTDVLAAGIVLWELLSGRRMYEGVDEEIQMIGAISLRKAPPLDALAPELPASVSLLVERALRKSPEERFSTAAEMARALRQALPPAPPVEVGAWVHHLVGPILARRAQRIASIELGEPAPRKLAHHDLTPGSERDRPSSPLHSARPLTMGDDSRRTATIDAPLRRPGKHRGWRARGAPRGGAPLRRRRRRDDAKQGAPRVQREGRFTAALPRRRERCARGTRSPEHRGAASLPRRRPTAHPTETEVVGRAAGAPPAPAASRLRERARARAQRPPGACRGCRCLPTQHVFSTPAPPKVTAQPARGTQRKPSCDPPWEKDASGILRVKKGCLR
ncbi:MAG: protein kinase [Polyangiaceae bacterium]